MNAATDDLSRALELTEQLPPRLRALVDLIGISATVKLVNARRGQRVYVPSRPDPEGWLVKAIGAAAAEKLIAEMPGEMLEVPKADGPLRQIRNLRMRYEHFKMGVTAGRHAEREDLTIRQVRTIYAEGDTLPDSQLDMYG